MDSLPVLKESLFRCFWSWFRPCSLHWKPFDRKDVISGGTTGLVQKLPCGHVRKTPYPDSPDWILEDTRRAFAIEAEAYRRLNREKASHFLKLIEYNQERGLILQATDGQTLRSALLASDAHTSISVTQRLIWATHIAESLRALHRQQIIHCDLKAENILLCQDNTIYLIDFAGSAIDGSSGFALESIRYYLPRPAKDPSTVRTDMFALGSTIYEIMTGVQPYKDLEDKDVEARFTEQNFPSVTDIICGDVILGCWTNNVKNPKQAHQQLMTYLGNQHGELGTTS